MEAAYLPFSRCITREVLAPPGKATEATHVFHILRRVHTLPYGIHETVYIFKQERFTGSVSCVYNIQRQSYSRVRKGMWSAALVSHSIVF